jgi:eukaryotic-like serine/threonine-protein kinase
MAQRSGIEETIGAAARVGSTLHGKWRFDALIDVGGMAAVYAATHSSGARGAIKILHPHAPLTPEVACTFLRDGHPNAVRVLEDHVDDDGNICVVMELLEGATFRECAEAEGGKLAPSRVLCLIDPVLDGLAALHEAGIVHRDIKPENLFLTNDGQVKILDFGLASLCEPTSESRSTSLAGQVMGTPEFMSPEQARGRGVVNAQSDLWSVGATAFTLLSGEFVHREASLPELLTSVFASPARSLSMALPDAHPALVELVDRALERRLTDRWKDAPTMQAAGRAAFLAMYGMPLSSVAPDRGRKARRLVAAARPGPKSGARPNPAR